GRRSQDHSYFKPEAGRGYSSAAGTRPPGVPDRQSGRRQDALATAPGRDA
nr:hypothetical protein [Tanacetum cinerariifolium]